MTAVNPSSFPDVLECTSADPVLRGQYKLLPSAGLAYQLNFVETPANQVVYVYSRVGTKSVYLIYCEGVPELLPGDIWETVIAEALSRNAEANMSVSMRESVSVQVCQEVCGEIKLIATEVSKELLGWLIVSAGTSHMVPLARCIQRLPDPVASPEVLRQASPMGMAGAFWEVREAASSKDSVPEWMSRGLDAGWVALVTQSGYFKKDDKFTLRPGSNVAPLVTKPVPLSALRRMGSTSNRMPTLFESTGETSVRSGIIPSAGVLEQVDRSKFVWNLIGSSAALDKVTRDAFGLESMPFANEQGHRFTVDLVPSNESGLVSVTLRRQMRAETVSFKISLGGGQSGVKVLSSEKNVFAIVLDPRAVFGSTKAPSKIERAVMLAALTLTVEFVNMTA